MWADVHLMIEMIEGMPRAACGAAFRAGVSMGQRGWERAGRECCGRGSTLCVSIVVVAVSQCMDGNGMGDVVALRSSCWLAGASACAVIVAAMQKRLRVLESWVQLQSCCCLLSSRSGLAVWGL